MAWVFTVDGQKFSTADLTLDEVVAVEQATGVGWYALNPVESAAQARALLVEIYARTRSRDEAKKIVGALTVRDAARSIDWENDDDRPIEFENGIPVVDPKEGTGEPATT